MAPSSFNIIVFGETGVGKSSVINLIAGKKVADTSSDGRGCTLESKQYTFPMKGRTFHIWDTVGLGEPFLSETHYLGAIEKAHTLIRHIKAHGGLDLLLFCIPGDSPVTPTMLCNYRLFFEVLCEKRIPIGAVVTRLEEEEIMEEWWARNEKHLTGSGLKFSRHACVTGLLEHPKAAEGRDSLERLLVAYDLKRSFMPPVLGPGLLTRLLNMHQTDMARQSQMEQTLRDRCKFDDVNARQLAMTFTRPACNPSPSTQGTRSSFNVIIFGEAGAGKSSVINLIARQKIANTSRDAWGCTLESKEYRFEVAKKIFNVWDTIGLGEPTFSVSNCFGAIEKTHTLIKQIEAQGGLDLLLFCMPGSRVTATMQSNYRLFFEVLCKQQIPIAAVVTRLEDEERMEEWWDRNVTYLSKGGLTFGGHACVTGQPGNAKATEGRAALELLLLGYDQQGRYPMPPASDWFTGFLERLPNIPRSKDLKGKQKELERLLRDRCMMDRADAQRLAETLTH